jgi:hypothetical protein
MKREDEIINAAIEYGNSTHSYKSGKLNETNFCESSYCVGFMEGCEWADKHPSSKALANELYRLGYTVNLNGEVIPKHQEDEHILNYINDKKQEFIENAYDWLLMNMYDYYDGESEFAIAGGLIKRDEFLENFKQAMKEE